MNPEPISNFDRRAFLVEPVLSWSAIFAGAAVALASSALLTLLAAGFGVDLAPAGLASNGSLVAFTPAFGAASMAIQVISAGLGGYLAGRLRSHWLVAHSDEAHFRDTAHGLIAWAIATIAGLLLADFVLIPNAQRLALITTVAAVAPLDPYRAANILAQAAFFTAIGMLLSALTAAIAARIGGLRSEEMHQRSPAWAPSPATTVDTP
jgi:hypothetical protein